MTSILTRVSQLITISDVNVNYANICMLISYDAQLFSLSHDEMLVGHGHDVCHNDKPDNNCPCTFLFSLLMLLDWNTMSSVPPLRRTDSGQGDFSPLKHFVVAKKKICDVFEQLLAYVEESSQFVEGECVICL